MASSRCSVSLPSVPGTVCQGVWRFPFHAQVGDSSEALQKLLVPSGLVVTLICLPSSWATAASPITSSIPEAAEFVVVLSGRLW